jgi:hypothetical protein
MDDNGRTRPAVLRVFQKMSSIVRVQTDERLASSKMLSPQGIIDAPFGRSIMTMSFRARSGWIRSGI